MKTAKLGAIFLVSVMALAGTGAAYAMWFDYLYIDGYVETGYLEAQFTYVTLSDPYSAAGEQIDEVCDDYFSNIRDVDPPKDVGWMDAEISGDGHTLEVDFYNTYPGYYGNCNYHLKNTGTIAWHYDHLNFYANGVFIATITSAGTWYYWDDYEWEIYFEVPVCSQVHPGDFLDISFGVHIFQGALQDHLYTFTLEPVVIQYNEEWTGPYQPPLYED